MSCWGLSSIKPETFFCIRQQRNNKRTSMETKEETMQQWSPSTFLLRESGQHVEQSGQTCSVSNVCQLFQEQTTKDAQQGWVHILSAFWRIDPSGRASPPRLATSGKLYAYSILFSCSYATVLLEKIVANYLYKYKLIQHCVYTVFV